MKTSYPLGLLFSQISVKILIKINQLWLNKGVTLTNIPLKAEYDIAWFYKCQFEIRIPTFTFYNFWKQPCKYAV